MKRIGTIQFPRWGRVAVLQGTYMGPEGPTAIVLQCDDGEPLATLSVNMYRPECSHDSRALPPGCFYVKTWAENEELVDDALASGMFRAREDLPKSSSGFVEAPVWEVAHG